MASCLGVISPNINTRKIIVPVDNAKEVLPNNSRVSFVATADNMKLAVLLPMRIVPSKREGFL